MVGGEGVDGFHRTPFGPGCSRSSAVLARRRRLGSASSSNKLYTLWRRARRLAGFAFRSSCFSNSNA